MSTSTRVPLAALAVSLVAFCARPAAGIAQPQPIHVWHFDEPDGAALLDAVADDFEDLRLYGGARRVEGRFGRAISTGDGGYAEGPGVGALQSGAVELWVMPLEALTGGQFGLIGFGRAYGGRSDSALLGTFPHGTNGASFGFGICPSDWTGVHAQGPPAQNEWHHVAANWGQAGIELFVDGQLVARGDSHHPIREHAAVLLGASSWGRTWRGVIDEVRIYDEPLPADVVRRHHANASYVAEPPQPSDSLTRYGPAQDAVLNAADFDNPHSFTHGIQEAIDALPRRGGEVFIPPGLYMIRRSIWLRDSVTLRGAGASTVLLPPDEVQTDITAVAGGEDTTVHVADPSRLVLGADVSVYGEGVHGWHSTTGHLLAIDGHAVTLSRGLNKAVRPDAGAGLISYFPMITAKGASNVTIRDLCIDGRAGRPNEGVKDFTWAAIHLCSCRDSRIEGCWIRNWISDGISVQGGRGATVSGNIIENSRGHGLHPGTGLADSVWIDNISRENVRDGLFFCMYVRHSVVSGNVLADNLGCGIGHVGGGGDQYNVVSGNTCVGNGRFGIQAVDGSDNVITSNVCLNNSQGEPGRYPGIGVTETTNTIVADNRCVDDQDTKTQAGGIIESDDSDRNVFTGNHCRGNAGPGLTVTGPNSREYGNIQ